jgi:hypothetical protein
MPDLKPNDIQSLFTYMEAETPPNMAASVIVGMFVNYLKGRVSGQARQQDDGGRRAPFRESFFSGYRAEPGVDETNMRAACPGDHDKWASALLGQAIYNAVPATRGLMNYDKLKAAVGEMNGAFTGSATRLYILYFRAKGFQQSEANRDAYIKLLLSSQWRSAIAAKQASSAWKNPSWEMYCHWVKLSACWGQNMVVETNPLADMIDRQTRKPRPWEKDFPPPFIDPSTTERRPTPIDGDVLRVYGELQNNNPKVILSGYTDIAPQVWTDYRGWINGLIDYDFLKANTGFEYGWTTTRYIERGARINLYNKRLLAEDCAETLARFR